MGFQIWVLSMCFWAYYLSLNNVLVNANTLQGKAYIDGRGSIGKIDEDFICATLDWWPPERCDYGSCSWGHTSLLNLDLNNLMLFKAVKAFSPLKLRLGGTLQNIVMYESKDSNLPCNQQFSQKNTVIFGFTPACLPLKRWDELNNFFKKTGTKIVFGLNALAGKTIQPNGFTTGAWDRSNAESLIRYSAEKGYDDIVGWELGNELSGEGVEASISSADYAADLTSLNKLLEEVHKGSKSKPLAIAPGGFFDQIWFSDFVKQAHNDLAVVTHHIYNLGPALDRHLVEKIFNASYLDEVRDVYGRLQNILRSSKTPAVSWVGEAGGAYRGGQDGVTNAFLFSFWYLDQLGMSASYDTRAYCRQSLIGGNYGLLNTTTFTPNPDYYSALLWHRLMGQNVLSTSFSGTKNLRAYAHCTKQAPGITLLLLNLNGNAAVQTDVSFRGATTTRHTHHEKQESWRSAMKWLPKKEAGETVRTEYHLTAKDGDLHSKEMLLNGKVLSVNSAGDIPPFNPLHVKSYKPIVVAPYSIAFIHIPYIQLPACK